MEPGIILLNIMTWEEVSGDDLMIIHVLVSRLNAMLGV